MQNYLVALQVILESFTGTLKRLTFFSTTTSKQWYSSYDKYSR